MGRNRQDINHYHIEELKVETKIDYKKLAKEIVAAQEEAKKIRKRPNRFRASAMVYINVLVSALMCFFAVLACVGMWMKYAKNPQYEISTYIEYTFVFTAIAVVSVGCGVEALKDDDENAIMHFNTNVAFAALIVAFLALIKG